MASNPHPIVCQLDAIPAAKRDRYAWLRQQLDAGIEGVVEADDGYGLCLAEDVALVAAEFVLLERLCCPFLKFNLAFTNNEITLWLTGGEGVKAFLKEELALD